MDLAISSEKYDEQLANTAYSVGFILGDCYLQSYSVVKNGKRYPAQCVRIGKPDLDAIERVRCEVKSCFDVEYAVMPRVLASGIVFHQLYLWRKDVFEFFSVNTAFKSKIPEFYFSANDNIKRDFVAGLMDSDGYIAQRFDGSRWQVGFGMTNREIVAGAASIMRSLGVKVGSIGEDKKGDYRIVYRINPNIRSFIEAGCYFHAARKSDRLANCKAYLLGSETSNAASAPPDEGIVQHIAKAL